MQKRETDTRFNLVIEMLVVERQMDLMTVAGHAKVSIS